MQRHDDEARPAWQNVTEIFAPKLPHSLRSRYFLPDGARFLDQCQLLFVGHAMDVPQVLPTTPVTGTPSG